MPRYVLLFNWTEQGVRNAKDTTKRADKFRAQAEKFKVKVRETLWTMGPYDASLWAKRQMMPQGAGSPSGWAARATSGRLRCSVIPLQSRKKSWGRSGS